MGERKRGGRKIDKWRRAVIWPLAFIKADVAETAGEKSTIWN